MTTGIEILNRGFTDLIEVTPPGCRLSPLSNIRDEDRGKSPGRMNSFGEWGGYDWRRAPVPTPAEVEQWQQQKANIGLRATNFPAVDIDCTNAPLSNVIRGLALAFLGMAPERIGRAPKRLLIYRTNEPFRRMRLWIKEPNGTKQLIEVLGEGQQFVVAGIHPVTGKPYEWPTGMLDAEDCEFITRDQVDAWLTQVQDTLECFGYECEREGSGALATERAEINQAVLAGDAKNVQDALSFLPNTNELFPGRDDYLRVGYAIKAACGEDGYPLFEEWALAWEGNESFAGNDPHTVRADWERMQPPFEVGAAWLYEMAQKRGYDWAANEFEVDESLPAADDQLSDADMLAAYQAQGAASGGGAAGSGANGSAGRPDKYTDAAMSNRLVRRYGEFIRYCPEQSKWYAWNGERWTPDGKGDVYRLMSNLLHAATDEIYADGNLTPSERTSKAYTMGSQQKRSSCVAYAECEKALIAKVMDFDADPYLLNTPGGVVNLKTGEMVELSPAMLMTRVTAVTPATGMPLEWMRFLNEATGNDPEMIDYLQRVAGYALSGDKSVHSLHFFYGPGGNGKGTFLNTLCDVLHDYARVSSMDTFVSSRYDRHPTELAKLAGARLVVAQETDEGRAWDEAKLKQLTSDDKVSARFMREDFFEFVPTFKLLFSGNHRPSIKNVDDALKRRIHIVPFTRKPARVDTQLREKLKAEAAQILQWCIDGAVKFFADGFKDPASVHEATQEYFEIEDDFTQWLQERTAPGKANDFVETKALVDDYNEWAEANGERRRSTKSLAGLLTDHGFKRGRLTAKGGRGFIALKLMREPGDEFDYDPSLA